MNAPTLAAVAALASLTIAAAPVPAPRTVGSLVLDGVPDLPERITARTMQYQNTRGATLADWDLDGGILVSTRFGETNQLHRVSAPGAYREQLTFFKEPVSTAAFDAKRKNDGFWFLIDVGGGEAYQIHWYDRKSGMPALLTDGKSRNQSLSPARGGGKFAFASSVRNGKDFDLYVLENDAPRPALVKELEGQWSPAGWSPDDTKMLVAHYLSINESTLHILDPANGEMTDVNAMPGKKIAYGSAAWSGDAKSIFYSSDEDSDFLRLTRWDIATGKKEVLTPDLPWDVDAVAISRNGEWLAWTVNEGGTTALWLAPAAKPKNAKKVALPKGIVSGLAFDRTHKRLGFTMNTATSPSDVYSVDLSSKKLERWTFSEVGGLDASRFVEPELIEFPTFDGKKIPAWYYRPRGGTRAVPVVINIHGGPESQATAAFSPLTQYYVNELDVAVLVPNVRGSSGYGKSYLQLDNGVKREDSVKDIGALLDWVGTRPELDKSRVAVTGGSYGGYMVLASLIAYGDRLRCGVDVVGISSFVTFLENTEAYRRDLRRAEYGDERDPEIRKVLEAISPMANASKIEDPLFVVQGKNDPRVPFTEAEQIVATVRKNGTPVWYEMALDEGHGFQKKTNRDHYQNATILFLEEYLVK